MKTGGKQEMIHCPNFRPALIRKDMTVLDIVSTFRSTQAVFKQWDEKAGECICCNALFEPLERAVAKYNLDLHTLLRDLEKAAAESAENQEK